MTRSAAVILACCACALASCATMQQRVAPYPAYGQSAERFAQDSSDCEQWARSNAAPAGGTVAAGALGGAALDAGLSAALGAIAGSFFGAAGSGAALGAALGGAEGAVGGASAAAQSVDQQLMAAYQNCMAARGYVVGGFVSPPPVGAPVPSSVQAAANGEDRPSRSIEDRLRELRELHRDGLITDKEYRDRRREMLEEL